MTNLSERVATRLLAANEANRQTARQARRRFVPMNEDSSVRHFLKHVFRRHERWSEVLGLPVPFDGVPGVSRDAQKLLFLDEIAAASRTAEQIAGQDLPPARLMLALLVERDVLELERWIASTKQPADTGVAIGASAALSELAELAHTAGAAPDAVAGDAIIARIALDPALEGLSKTKLLRRLHKQGLLPDVWSSFASWPAVREIESRSPGELSALRDLCRRIRNQVGGDLADLARFVTSESAENHTRSSMRALLDRIEELSPGLFRAYFAHTNAAVENAAGRPRHCVYDFRGMRGNECYIDDAGVTVCLGRHPTEGRTFQVRTSYRPRDGRSSAEKLIEAVDASLLDRPTAAANAAVDFLRDMGRRGTSDRVRTRYTVEQWNAEETS